MPNEYRGNFSAEGAYRGRSGKIVKESYKELQLSKILRILPFQRLEAENFDSLTFDSKCKLLSTYLYAWEHVYGVSFQAPTDATLTKISGIRYIMYLLPTILEILKNNNTAPTEKAFKELIQKLPLATGVSDVFTDPSTVLAFRGGGATVKLAKEHSTLLMKHATATKPNFDLSEGFK